jgi:hypothetical protein
MNPKGPQDRLTPDDERVLDALADDGFAPDAKDALPADDRDRAERLEALMHLLRDYPVEDSDDTLVHATLARIDRHEDEKSARLKFDTNAEGRGARRIRVPDFISVAAVLLIVLGVVIPVLSHVQQRSVDLRCSNNLRYAGYAFSQYAADHDGKLPVAVAGKSISWDSMANILNLAPLIAGDYCDDGHLNCPGAEHADGVGSSYSYQCQPSGEELVWGQGPRTTLILGDRNPLVDAFRSGELIDSLTISLNHGGRGQWVLGSDGAPIWLETPVIGRGDRIWVPGNRSTLEAGALPQDRGDAFLAH